MFTVFVMLVARHTRPEGHFKVWTTVIFFQRPLPPTPTPRAGTGLPPFYGPSGVGFGIINPKFVIVCIRLGTPSEDLVFSNYQNCPLAK